MNTALDTVENPFASAPVAARPADTMVAAASSREIAEVQAAMVMARRFPRNEPEVMDRILQACTRPSLADGALYEYARGGTDIRGPSIRLAECVAQYWGHLDFGWRVLEERPGASKVQCFAWDMQNGTRAQVVFDVLHERHTRDGKKTLSDPRDVYELIANAASRRLRACILRVIPGDVIEAAVKQCEKTLTVKAEVTPERIANLLTQFADYGVTRAAIEKRIQRRLDAITPGMMVQLGKIFTSLRDGVSQPADWFEQGPPAAQEGATGAPGKPEGSPARAAVKRSLEQRKAAQQAPENLPDDPPAAIPPEKQPEAPPAAPAQPATPTPAPAPAPASAPPAAATAPAEGEPSDLLLDVVSFAKSAKNADDIAEAAGLAMQLVDEAEVRIAQEHLDAAKKRVGA